MSKEKKVMKPEDIDVDNVQDPRDWIGNLLYLQSLRVEIADILYEKGVLSQKQREGFNFVTNFMFDKKHFLNNIKMFCAIKEIPEETWKEVDGLIRNDERFDVLFPKPEEDDPREKHGL